MHSLDDYLADLIRRRTTANGVFGLKMYFAQFDWFVRETRTGFGRALRVVRLFRRDVVAQAISLHIAQVTGAWGATTPQRGDLAEIDYDFRRISRLIGVVLKKRNDWTQFFRQAGVEPRALAYETLIADPRAATFKVLDWLGIASGSGILDSPRLTSKQGTTRNLEWAERFRREAAQRGLPLPDDGRVQKR